MLIHLNGQLVPAERAQVSVFDRGFIFGDGLYEGLRSVRLSPNSPPRIIGVQRHIRRLAEGLAACRIAWDARQLERLTHELLAANTVADTFIYWQITRGTPAIIDGRPTRSRVPVGPLAPTVLGYCTPLSGLDTDESRGPALKRIVLQPDLRWHRGHIKSISLLGNIIPSLAAGDAGADEAVLVRDGLLTEGTYCNVAVVLPCAGLCHRQPAPAVGAGAAPLRVNGFEIVTPSLDSAPILNGITRQILIDLEPAIVQRPVRAEELSAASEVMLWGTTTMVSSVTHVDGKPTATGAAAGPVARRLNSLLVRAIREGREDSQCH